MSLFWKNVTDELQYQGMSIKTLSALTGIPYTTITNARNRSDSIPTADVALKISKVLNKPLEWLIGKYASQPKSSAVVANKKRNELDLYHKYERLIYALEKRSLKTQEAFINMAVAIADD